MPVGPLISDIPEPEPQILENGIRSYVHLPFEVQFDALFKRLSARLAEIESLVSQLTIPENASARTCAFFEMQTVDWYERWADALQRVMDTATARDAEKPETPGRKKAEEKYQDALACYREIAFTSRHGRSGPGPRLRH